MITVSGSVVPCVEEVNPFSCNLVLFCVLDYSRETSTHVTRRNVDCDRSYNTLCILFETCPHSIGTRFTADESDVFGMLNMEILYVF